MEDLIPDDYAGQEQLGGLLSMLGRLFDRLLEDRVLLACERALRTEDQVFCSPHLHVERQRFLRLNPDFMHRFLQE